MSFEARILDLTIVHMRKTVGFCYGSQNVVLATMYVTTVNSYDLMKYWLAN